MSSAVTATAQKYKCERCGKEFEPHAEGWQPENWYCETGGLHVVEKRVYLMNDAPQSAGRDGATGQPLAKHGRREMILWSRNVQELLSVGWIPGADEDVYDDSRKIEFSDGKYETSDAQEVFVLDGMSHKFCTEAEWRWAWASDEERKRITLDAGRQELERRQSELAVLEQEVEQLRKGA